MSRRILGIVTAVVLATAGTFVLVLYVQSAEERALAGEEVVGVLVVAEPIDKGTAASEITAVRREQVPLKVRALDAIDTLESVEGKVTAVALLPGEQLIASRFVEPEELVEEERVEIPEGMQVLTVSLEPSRALGGELRPGDTVGVFGSVEDPGDETDAEGEPVSSGSATHLFLNRVLVTNVQGDPQPAVADGEDETSTRPGVPGSNMFVSFALTAPDAERLVWVAEHGSIWLSLQDDATSDSGAGVQTKETIFR